MILKSLSRLQNLPLASLFSPTLSPKTSPHFLSFRAPLPHSTDPHPYPEAPNRAPSHLLSAKPSISDSARFALTVLFVPPGVDADEVSEEMILPGSNIVLGPYAGDSRVKEVEFVKSSARARDCPKDSKPEFAILGRSNVGKSSLINALVRKKEVALTSKKPGKTQLINHFLVNKSWYIVDLPGYGFAKASEVARMDWSSFTKGYFINRDTLVAVLLLIGASVPPQKIDLDCANWLGRNNIPMTFVFTKCDKMKASKGKRPDASGTFNNLSDRITRQRQKEGKSDTEDDEDGCSESFSALEEEEEEVTDDESRRSPSLGNNMFVPVLNIQNEDDAESDRSDTDQENELEIGSHGAPSTDRTSSFNKHMEHKLSKEEVENFLEMKWKYT